MIIRPLVMVLLLTSLLLIPTDVLSHHAFSSEFDADRPFNLQGSIVKVEWINPHTWVHIDVILEDGTIQSWMLEAGTPNTLLRRGLTRTLLQPGNQVIVRGYQSKDPDCDPKCWGSGRDIVFADGRRLFMGSTGTGAPEDGADPSENPQD